MDHRYRPQAKSSQWDITTTLITTTYLCKSVVPRIIIVVISWEETRWECTPASKSSHLTTSVIILLIPDTPTNWIVMKRAIGEDGYQLQQQQLMYSRKTRCTLREVQHLTMAAVEAWAKEVREGSLTLLCLSIPPMNWGKGTQIDFGENSIPT